MEMKDMPYMTPLLVSNLASFQRHGFVLRDRFWIKFWLPTKIKACSSFSSEGKDENGKNQIHLLMLFICEVNISNITSELSLKILQNLGNYLSEYLVNLA